MVMPVGRSLVFSGSQAKNISYPTDHRQKIFRTLPIKGLPITLASSLSPLNVPKTGFPWSIPPDLARLTPSDRYPELDNNNFSPCSGPFDPNSPNSQTSSPEGVVLCVRRLDPSFLRGLGPGTWPTQGLGPRRDL